MTLPAVDLRSSIEQVYHQSLGNACTAHFIVNCLEAMFDNAGQSKRFSRAWVWWWSRVHSGRAGQDVGADFSNMKWALETHGVVLESQHPWTGQAANFPPAGLTSVLGKIKFIRVAFEVEAIKRKLCLGLPIGIGMDLSSDFNSLYGQRNWRTHTYNVRAPMVNRHAMCIVGYDDAAGRLLIENSYGPSFADGGFFGLRYEDLPYVTGECWSIDWIEGFQPKPAEGYVSIPFYLPPSDFQQHWAANKPIHKAEIDRLAATEGVQAIIDYVRARHINDRMIENMYLQPRGTLRDSYEASKEVFNWDGFPWTEM